MASAAEVLRHRDVAALTAGERRRLAAMFATLRPRPPPGVPPGTSAWHRGDLDASRTLRGTPAPDGRARPRSRGAAAASGRAGWCC